MRKLITAILVACFMGLTVPVMPAMAGNGVKAGVIEGSKLKKAGKTSKSNNSAKKKSTKERVKKLNQLGIPKSLQKFGNDLSLHEMGTIIAAWIIQVWTETGQLPTTITSNPPDWLMLKINGTCFSSAATCNRWNE